MKVAFLVPDNRDESKRWDDPAPYFGTAPTALLEGFSRLQGVEIHVVSCVHRPMEAPARIGPNIHFHALHVPRLGWRALYTGCIWAIRNKLREIQPDIVHGQGTERYCALSAVFSGFPNVITLHGNMREILKFYSIGRSRIIPWITARLEALTLPRTEGVICITTHTQRLVADLAPKTWIVPNAVAHDFFNIHRDPSASKELLVPANIGPWKNQIALIRALDGLERHDFHLTFVGSGNAGSAYMQEFTELVSARPWCRHLGFVAPETLRSMLARATGVVLPSLEDNCPMAILEAEAAGVPVGAAKIGGIPDLIEHEKTGLLFNPREPAEIRHAVAALLEHLSKAQEMAGRAKALAKERFFPELVAERHLEIYQEVLRQSWKNKASGSQTAIWKDS